ncbi:mandelate racemase/muconate lactonizing enzyme family protein [Rhodopirellula sallentina]|uniref:mandelate racemase/muconate lactonizing enzyme family protein n=1 Tax=Rhodopirellula sallentina TaxID=1263869 RepID=UPI001F43C16A|nr:mandelate racemase/muconate lactonizing enzyme family protein [Rhodopirellula sallentina]
MKTFFSYLLIEEGQLYYNTTSFQWAFFSSTRLAIRLDTPDRERMIRPALERRDVFLRSRLQLPIQMIEDMENQDWSPAVPTVSMSPSNRGLSPDESQPRESTSTAKRPTSTIKCIRTHHLRDHLEVPFGFSQWYYDTRNTLWVEIVAEDGTSGWGECYGPSEVYQTAIDRFYAPRLLNQNALATDALWHLMWRSSLDFARGGVMMGAMSGIDMALWDLRGKTLGLSVSELMGGRYVDEVPCYATGMYFKEMPEADLIQSIVEEASMYQQLGFQALKIKVGKNLAFDARQIESLRDALPNMTMMADSNHAFDLPEAIQIGRVLEENDFKWFEEPLSPEFEGQFRQLQDKLDMPIATGECEQTRYGFQRLLSTGGVQIAQPDLAYCGGPSEALKIRNLASSMGINVVPHCWGTMLNLASATHFLASGYREPGRKENAPPLLEYDRTPNALRDELFDVPVAVENGIARVPTGPGLGVKVNEDKMQSFVVQQTELKA